MHCLPDSTISSMLTVQGESRYSCGSSAGVEGVMEIGQYQEANQITLSNKIWRATQTHLETSHSCRAGKTIHKEICVKHCLWIVYAVIIILVYVVYCASCTSCQLISNTRKLVLYNRKQLNCGGYNGNSTNPKRFQRENKLKRESGNSAGDYNLNALNRHKSIIFKEILIWRLKQRLLNEVHKW